MLRWSSLFALFLASGCTSPNLFEGPNMDFYGDSSMGTVEARVQATDMPHVGTFGDDSRHGWYSEYGDWMDFGVDAYGDYGWAMLLVSGDKESGWVDVIGCSGEEDGYADFDEPAVDSELELSPRTDEDGEEVIDFTVFATFADGSTASSAGTIRPSEEPVYY
jgi:hypothetical protein